MGGYDTTRIGYLDYGCTDYSWFHCSFAEKSVEYLRIPGKVRKSLLFIPRRGKTSVYRGPIK